MRSMKLITSCFGILLVTCGAVQARGQPLELTRPAQLKKLDAWTGNWSLSGTARDQPDGHEYVVRWYLREHWILNGFFLQVDQTWEGNGQVTHALEMLSYDPIEKVYTDSGFGSDGSTWTLTATFHGAMMIERGKAKGPGGVVTRCLMTWVFSNDSESLSGTERCDRNGVHWRAVDVKGRKLR
jgi:hypothetical protein